MISKRGVFSGNVGIVCHFKLLADFACGKASHLCGNMGSIDLLIAATEYSLGDKRLGRKPKYTRVVVDTYRVKSQICVRGARPGPRSAEEKRMFFALPQAQSIIHKFGGARELARVLREMSDDPKHHLNPSSIYRWMYPREVGGFGGEIPARHIKLIIKAARFAGIFLEEKDIYPHLFPPPLAE